MPIPQNTESDLRRLDRLQDRWVEQYRRLHRWYERLEQPIRVDLDDPEAGLDYYYAFFLNCLSLRDWLCNDDNWARVRGKSRGDVCQEVCAYVRNQHNTLYVCWHIANSNKHLVLDRGPHKGGQVALDRASGSEWDQGQDQWTGLKTVFIGNPLRDAHDLASKCIEAWDWYIEDKLC